MHRRPPRTRLIAAALATALTGAAAVATATTGQVLSRRAHRASDRGPRSGTMIR
ncbi:hypothetical protein [Phytohabitans kaempferiae]|uniref:Uncharacterized protein n=1 Tax=Phytohabitans kaempferiae TaxID=1620943 RepID=A0ABV6M7R5_9ACTN